MVGHPVQRGVGEHDVVAAVGLPQCGDITGAELQARDLELVCLCEHRVGAVDPDGLARLEPPVRSGGQLTRAAAEIDDPWRRCAGLHELEEIEERLGSLGAEAVVLGRIPGVRGSHVRCSPAQSS